MSRIFLDLARRGKNTWWRYFLSSSLLSVGWPVFALIMYVLLIAWAVFDHNPHTAIDVNTGMITNAPLLNFVALMLGFVGLALTLYVSARYIHRRAFLTLITPRARVDWRRLLIGFAFFFLLAALAGIVEALLFPGRYRFALNGTEFLKFLPAVLVLLPIQTTSEELLFRGYLMQSIGLWIHRPLVSALLSSLMFMLLHLVNPEVGSGFWRMALVYFGMGLLFALVTLKDNRLELAIGAHAANNLFAALFANYADSPLPTPALFTTSKIDATYALVSFLVIATLFYAGLFARKRSPQIMRQKAEED